MGNGREKKSIKYILKMNIYSEVMKLRKGKLKDFDCIVFFKLKKSYGSKFVF